MLFELALFFFSGSVATYALLGYIEHRQLWTLRLKLSVWLPGWPLLIAFCLSAFHLIWTLRGVLVWTHEALTVLQFGLATAAFFIIILVYAPLLESRAYVRLRWKAWSGPSRTGIAPHLSRYLGSEQDWRSMRASCTVLQLHPIERFSSLGSTVRYGIVEDATTILNARYLADEQGETIWVPRSSEKSNVYMPAEAEQPVSLLWGANLGFHPRSSRGILAVPQELLRFQPRLSNGVDGRPLCLAHAILARNKGLEPQRLVCNLEAKRSFLIFEQNSVLWPRPSKTLRSFYTAEMRRSYSGLGDSFVAAASELALLIADTTFDALADWLDGQQEHQDLKLNHQVAQMGATSEELSRLYRGQYAAMLVSLSLHRPGSRIRPELLVYRALHTSEGLSESPAWLEHARIRARLRSEELAIGDRGLRLVGAVI